MLVVILPHLGCGGGGLQGNASGGGSVQPGTPLGTYSITVTAAAGAVIHSVQLQLIVQGTPNSGSGTVTGSWLINAGSPGPPQVLIEANLSQDGSGNITAMNGQIAAIAKVGSGWAFGDCLSSQSDGMEHDSFQGTINTQGQVNGTFGTGLI